MQLHVTPLSQTINFIPKGPDVTLATELPLLDLNTQYPIMRMILIIQTQITITRLIQLCMLTSIIT